MLLFICMEEDFPYQLRNFNTSHVTVYHRNNSYIHQLNSISIHLMLLFIIDIMHKYYAHIYISIHLMLLFICSVFACYK